MGKITLWRTDNNGQVPAISENKRGNRKIDNGEQNEEGSGGQPEEIFTSNDLVCSDAFLIHKDKKIQSQGIIKTRGNREIDHIAISITKRKWGAKH